LLLALDKWSTGAGSLIFIVRDADFWSLKPVLLAGDAGAIRARRVLDKLIKDEQAA
jgi:hypothetical protein